MTLHVRLSNIFLAPALVLAFSLAGCAYLPEPIPFKNPEPGLSLEKRQELYRQHKVQRYPFIGYTVNGQAVGWKRIREYLEASGDTTSARRIVSGIKWGQGIGLVTLAGFVGSALQQDEDRGATISLSSFTVGLLALFVPTTKIKRGVSAFNANLKKRLELPPEFEARGIPVITPPRINPDSVDARGNYLRLGPGINYISNRDLSDFLADNSGWRPDWVEDKKSGKILAIDYGMVFKDGWTLEIGLELGPDKDAGIRWNKGQGPGLDRAEHLFVGRQSITALGGVTLSPQGAKRHILLGIRGGYSWIFASKGAYDHNVDQIGWADYRAGAPTVSPVIRISYPVTQMTSVGLEAGYNIARFDNLKRRIATGILVTEPSRLKNRRGEEASFDYSGPYIALTMKLGKLPYTR